MPSSPHSGRPRGIIMLVPAFPATEEDSVWLPALQNFVEAIARRNPEIAIHVVAFQYPYQRSRYRWHEADVHALAGRNSRFPMRFGTWWRAASEVRRLMRRNQVIAIHSHWLAECTYVASWINRSRGIKHIATIHGQDALAGNPYLKRLPLEKLTVTAMSEHAAETFFKSTGRRVDYIIPTGLDAEALVSTNGIDHRTIDILGVGSLTPTKDFRSFLEIISELRRDHPNLRCMIIGQGPEAAQLERYIEDQKLRHIVRLPGQLPRETVLKTMRNARILLHTSRYEGQGYVFLEALAAGMRVVCRDVGYIGSGEGTYRCESVSGMVEVLRRLLSSDLHAIKTDVMSVDQTAAAFETIYGIG